jgi:hypothetical protein
MTIYGKIRRVHSMQRALVATITVSVTALIELATGIEKYPNELLGSRVARGENWGEDGEEYSHNV